MFLIKMLTGGPGRPGAPRGPGGPCREVEKSDINLSFIFVYSKNMGHFMKISYNWAGDGWAAGLGGVEVAHLRREVL